MSMTQWFGLWAMLASLGGSVAALVAVGVCEYMQYIEKLKAETKTKRSKQNVI